MSELKGRLRSDLTAAMKAKDVLRRETLRMVLAAVMTAEVAGTEARGALRRRCGAGGVGEGVEEAHGGGERCSRRTVAGRLADKERAEAPKWCDRGSTCPSSWATLESWRRWWISAITGSR